MNDGNIVSSPLVIAPVSADEMLARLAFMKTKPRVVLQTDANAPTVCAALKQCYPEAEVLAGVASESLPNQYVDLLFANVTCLSRADLLPTLTEWRRVLRADGLLMFTFLGPDTLRAWQEQVTLPPFVDMHDVGDLLLKEGFADPVLDIDYVTVTYRDKQTLAQELYKTGLSAQPLSPEAIDMPPNADGVWEMVYEVVFASAFVPSETEGFSSNDGEVSVPLSHLRRLLGRR